MAGSSVSRATRDNQVVHLSVNCSTAGSTVFRATREGMIKTAISNTYFSAMLARERSPVLSNTDGRNSIRNRGHPRSSEVSVENWAREAFLRHAQDGTADLSEPFCQGRPCRPTSLAIYTLGANAFVSLFPSLAENTIQQRPSFSAPWAQGLQRSSRSHIYPCGSSLLPQQNE